MKFFVRQSLALGAGMVLAVFAGAGVQAQTGSDAGTDAQPRTLQMVPAQAELGKTLDAKKAKQGDPVTAKLQQDVQMSDGKKLPKNTVLEGQVDSVQPSQNKGDSTLVITFDKAKTKDGQELPIKATIIRIYEPVLMQQQQAQSGPPAAGGPSGPVGGGSPSGGSAGGGGQHGSIQPQQPSELPEAPQGQTQQSQSNGVPGVTLKSDVHDKSSGTFTSQGKNVRVPGGTEMEVALTVIPAGVKLQ